MDHRYTQPRLELVRYYNDETKKKNSILCHLDELSEILGSSTQRRYYNPIQPRQSKISRYK